MSVQDEERITLQEDLEDDETIVEDPQIRRAKTVLFLVVMGLGISFIVVLLVFFQPEGVVMTESWPNGYPKTRTTYVSAPTSDGRVRHGAYRAWHENGQEAARGRFEEGERQGAWRFWSLTGELDTRRSGVYLDGVRMAPLGA
jgi:hypothetical protein